MSNVVYLKPKNVCVIAHMKDVDMDRPFDYAYCKTHKTIHVKCQHFIADMLFDSRLEVKFKSLIDNKDYKIDLLVFDMDWQNELIRMIGEDKETFLTSLKMGVTEDMLLEAGKRIAQNIAYQKFKKWEK